MTDKYIKLKIEWGEKTGIRIIGETECSFEELTLTTADVYDIHFLDRDEVRKIYDSASRLMNYGRKENITNRTPYHPRENPPPIDQPISIDDIVNIINFEIQWCYQNKDGYDITDHFHMGFVKGLEQAKYLVIKLANEVEKT